ncbi:MAG: Na+/H+ antiporter NhaA [Acidobacteria bacterium]|nr:MAG: Na+/H+ antiporter NhaA [Acidobacteriota bacterium]
MRVERIREFLRMEASGGIILVAAAGVALLWANSPAGSWYEAILETPVAVQVGAGKLAKPLLLWINDGLMAIFFLLVGMEIKREVLQGELSSAAKAALPAVAAVGGMAAPAAIYLLLNAGDPEALRGWAIPAATDIAFAVGVLALLGGHAPASLKIFLLALAILDDLGAIVVIAAFYTADLSLAALALAAAGIVGLVVLNVAGVQRLGGYILLGAFLWVCVLKSGVHATLAGVVTAFAIPLSGRPGEPDDLSPLNRLEHALHPWVAFGILPLFAFANAGVSLDGMSLGSIAEPVPFGIAAGLFVGKQVGVMLATWFAVRLGVGALPEGASWTQFYGMALLTGIGFTMSLFIGTLAFQTEHQAAAVRIGVIGGSLLSALAGYTVLRLSSPQSQALRAAAGRRGGPASLS